MKRFATVFALLAAAAWSAAPASAQLINEMRIDETGTDVDEYFEIVGTPNSSLDGLFYLVIGDGTGGCGTIECVVDLSGYSIQADGYFAACKSATPNLSGYDAVGVSAINFENSDNVTHMLVQDFNGSLNDDVDTNDDGVIDNEPWGAVVDCVALLEQVAPACGVPTTSDEAVYCDTTVGPDGSFVPGMAFRCGTDWLVGNFTTGVDDTPGTDNNCPVPVESSTWGSIKSRY